MEITVLDSPIHTCTATGGQGTANDPILVDINTPPQPDSPVKVVLGERYRYDDLCCASTFDLICCIINACKRNVINCTISCLLLANKLYPSPSMTGELCALSVQYPTVNPAIPILKRSCQMTKRIEMREKRCSGICVLLEVSTSINIMQLG